MARPLKEYRYKSIGKSLAQYKEGEYVGSIPHELLYQLLRALSGNGKAEVLAKLDLIKDGATKVGSGKENIISPERGAPTGETYAKELLCERSDNEEGFTK